uniref:Ovule protein n=1 Tax=Brugia timori TaxID=42155 RepID=A0A0R3QF06_9BILA
LVKCFDHIVVYASQMYKSHIFFKLLYEFGAVNCNFFFFSNVYMKYWTRILVSFKFGRDMREQKK